MGKTRKPKPYENPLSPQLAEDILNIPIEEPEQMPPPRTIGERVRRAIEAIEEANKHLATSPVAKIVARSLMQEMKRRGDATIAVRPDGTVVLRVSYGETPEPEAGARPRRDAPMVQTTHRSEIPYLDELRAEAADLGVDISHLGRQRRAIYEYLQAHKRNLKGTFDEVRVTPAEPTVLPRQPRRKHKGVPPDNGHAVPVPEGGDPPAREVDIADLLNLD